MSSNKQTIPRYKDCFVCGHDNHAGLDVTFFYDDKGVSAECSFDEHFRGYQNRIHGGVISGLLDEAMGWSATMQTKWFYYTISLNVKFHKPVVFNHPYEVHAQFLKNKRQFAFAKAILIDPKDPETIIASSEGTFYQVSKEEQADIVAILDDKI